jgi:hypothetical protein
MGLAGGVNLYRYAEGNPLTNIDTLGLSPRLLPPSRTGTRPCTNAEQRICESKCLNGMESCRVSRTFQHLTSRVPSNTKRCNDHHCGPAVVSPKRDSTAVGSRPTKLLASTSGQPEIALTCRLSSNFISGHDRCCDSSRSAEVPASSTTSAHVPRRSAPQAGPERSTDCFRRGSKRQP